MVAVAMGWKLEDALSDATRRALRMKPAKKPVVHAPVKTDYVVCPSGKAPFATREEAEARRREIVDMAYVHDMRTYRCSYCLKFHLGHQRGSR